jgi:predicted SprT family Zn-dependent metalloprotease
MRVVRARAAALALTLVRAHEPALERYLRIEWKGFTWRMGDARLFKVRGRLTAQVRLSIPLWPRASEEERDQTVAHEVAHLIQRWRQRRGDYARAPVASLSSHGVAWRSVMRELGYKPDRCHEVPTGAARACAGGCGVEVLVHRRDLHVRCPACAGRAR